MGGTLRWHARGGLLAGVTLRRPTSLTEGAPFTNALYVGPPDEDDEGGGGNEGIDEGGNAQEREEANDEDQDGEEDMERAAKRTAFESAPTSANAVSGVNTAAAAVTASGNEVAIIPSASTTIDSSGSSTIQSNDGSNSAIVPSNNGVPKAASTTTAAISTDLPLPAPPPLLASIVVCSCVLDNSGAAGAGVMVDGGACAAFRACTVTGATTSAFFVPWGRALLHACKLLSNGLCGVTLLDRGMCIAPFSSLFFLFLYNKCITHAHMQKKIIFIFCS